MSDFITLSCSSCGGKLNVQKNSPTYICEYCGTEHKLREEDIESFGRCPKCHRNDRVEKITAIVNKHDKLAAKLPSPDHLNLDRYVERPDLASEQNLNSLKSPPITESLYSKRSKNFFIVMGIFLFQTFYLIFIGADSDKGILNFYFLVSLFGSFVLAFFGIYNFIKAEIEQREQELLTQQKEVNNQKSFLTLRKSFLAHKLKSRYDKIYYCHRDDLLFIPGGLGYASCNDYEAFLTQELITVKKAE